MARMSQSRNAILTMTLVTQNAIADTTFDGTWFVTVNAHQYENPDGSAPLAWVMNFPAEVKNGVLHELEEGSWEPKVCGLLQDELIQRAAPD
jgi:hypothetical protein